MSDIRTITKVVTVRIDPEFRHLIPSLSDSERLQLEANLDADGCRDPLVVWNGLLLDGHHRYELCEAHGWPYRTVEQPCKDRDDAKIWIIRNQFGRRNLQPYQRGELALVLEPLIRAKAKANEQARKGLQPGASLPTLVNLPVHTQEELANASGLSKGTIAKVAVIADKASEDVKTQLRRGDISIDRAYQDIRGQERGDAHETIASPEDPGDEDPSPTLYVDPPWPDERIKTGGGRPRLPDPRCITLRLSVNREELLKFQILAVLSGGISLSQICRDIILDELNSMLSEYPRNKLIAALQAHGLDQPAIATLITSL